MRVEPARVRQHPHWATADLLRLEAHPRRRPPERGAVGGQADDRHQPGRVPSYGRLERGGARAQLPGAQLRGGAGGAEGEVGDADAVPRELVVRVGPQAPRREPRRVERRPEAVAGAREVVADLGRAQRGVDPHEQDPQARTAGRSGSRSWAGTSSPPATANATPKATWWRAAATSTSRRAWARAGCPCGCCARPR